MKRTTAKAHVTALGRAGKKAVSVLASAALALSMFGIPAFADPVEGEGENQEALQQDTEPSTGEDIPAVPEGPTDNTTEDPDPIEPPDSADSDEGSSEEEPGGTKLPTETDEMDQVAKSVIHVDVTDAKPFDREKPNVFFVTLSNRGQQRIDMTETGSFTHGSYTYKAVDPGEYTLTVQGEGYGTYSQAITVADDIPRTYTLKLNTYDRPSCATDVQTEQTGVIYYGDVTGEGDIDVNDIDAMISVIQGDIQPTGRCDLNGDEVRTLTDLQILAEGYERDKDGYGHDPLTSNIAPKPRVTGVTVSEGTVASDSKITDISEVVGNPDESVSLKLTPANPGGPIKIELNNLDKQLEGEQIQVMTIKPPVSTTAAGDVNVSPNAVTGGTVDVTYEEGGQEITETVEIDAEAQEASAFGLERMAQAVGLLPQVAYADNKKATIDKAGNIVIDFGKKIAIKKVTIQVTKTAASDGNLNLAEISSVEFLNDTADLIAPPELNIPQNLTATPGSKQFTLSWGAETNVTGYEISIVDPTVSGDNEHLMTTKNTTLAVTAYKYGKKGKLENNHTYTVKVRSTNGAWRSGWSDPITVTPKATKVPDAPESVKASGGYRTITVGWKAMEDTDTYTIFWRKQGDAAWNQNAGVERNNYQLSGLEDRTTYELYIVGVNEIGSSAPSRTVAAETTTIAPAELPNYKLLNTKDANGHYLTGIQSARVISANMVDSPLDAGKSTSFGLFDDDYTSYAKKSDWDLGCAYNQKSHGVEIAFDGVKQIGFISYAASSQNIDYSGVVVHASTGGSGWQKVDGVSFTQQKCANGRTYTLIKIDGGLTADKVIIGMQRYPRLIDIAEMRFHGYDSIEDDVNALFSDDMHIQLAEGVDEAKIQALETRLNTADADGNYYPFKNIVQLDIDFARQLLADENAGLSEIITVHTDISSNADSGKNLGISGLNSWQPLGKVAAAGDQLVLYASARNAKANSKVQIYVGQQYAESSDAPTYGGTFVPGKRVVYSVPEKIQDVGKEHGGQLYAQYTGNSNPNEEWCIRIMGGHSIPTLDLHNETDHEKRVQKAEAFITDLDETLDLLGKSKANEADHKAAHLAESKLVVDKVVQDTINPSVDVNYSETGCIHNAAEIMTDTMLYSVPAAKVAASCKGSTLRERAESLIKHMDGSEQLMRLFYQHKGLMFEREGATGSNRVSSQHLNIRCMQMFAGAFMYAAGNHIGVGYPESGNFAILNPISDAATAPGGTRASGDGFYFGWGTAHEIGHNINNNRYAYAEVTNNYFAQLCKMINEGTTRFSYDAVYDRVTSGAQGRTGSVMIQLAMYWQLMLAHDTHEVYTLYDNYADLQANRFFARVDGLARNPGSATKADGSALEIPLVVNAGESQNIIRLASAAAKADLTDFFVSWGLIPNAETQRFVAQFDKDPRALQYVNDDAVKWARANSGAAKVAGQDVVAVTQSQDNSRITLGLSTKDATYAPSLIGYEITRLTYASGQQQKEVAGFVRAEADGTASFVDDAAYLGNRAVQYEVKAVDKFLNYSVGAVTAQEKLNGNGRYTTDDWSVETNLVDADSQNESAPDEGTGDTGSDEAVEPECPSEKAELEPKPIDSILTGEGEFVGKTMADGNTPAADPYVLVDMHKTNPVVSIRYTPGEGTALSQYRIETSVNGLSFTEVATGTFQKGDEGYAEVFLTGKNEDGSPNSWICAENARYVRITGIGQAGKDISIKAVDIFGPSGDNIDFTAVEGQEDIKAIGTLTADFALDDKGAKIPAGSILFTGAVKGNPAYNVVVLYDETGTIVGGLEEDGATLKAEQVLLAELSEGSKIGDTADGRWVYWIAPGSTLPKQVRAELYRVNDAFTNEGQRLVADTVFVDVPADLPGITLTGASQGQ